MDAKVRTDFQVWMEKLGYHGKQVREAARRVGIGATNASQTSTGVRELSETERLAMAAVRAGLPPWTPETDQEIADLAEMQAIMQRMTTRQNGDDAPTAC